MERPKPLVPRRLHIMQASGGAMTFDEPNFVSFDRGGTSTDVSQVKNGQFRIVEETKEGGYHLRIPMMDITTIGAGGRAGKRLGREDPPGLRSQKLRRGHQVRQSRN